MITWRARAHQQCDSVLLLAYQTTRVIPERAGALTFHFGVRIRACNNFSSSNWFPYNITPEPFRSSCYYFPVVRFLAFGLRERSSGSSIACSKR
jgi:hypothetical protein